MPGTKKRTQIVLTDADWDWLVAECARRSETDIQKATFSKVIHELIAKARNGRTRNGTDNPSPSRKRKPVRLARTA